MADEYGREGAGLDFLKPAPPLPAASKPSGNDGDTGPVKVLQRPAEQAPFVLAAPPPPAPPAPKPSKSKDFGMSR